MCNYLEVLRPALSICQVHPFQNRYDKKLQQLPMQYQPVYLRLLPKKLKEMRKPDMLIIDDWGIGEINAAARTDLLELIEARTGSGSIIITSVLPVEKWSEYIGDPTVADSILDRLVRVSHRIKVNSKESMRKQKKVWSRKKLIGN